MKKKIAKISIALGMTMLSVFPAFALTTDITINGTFADVVSLQLERTNDSYIISEDNTDGTANRLETASNEILGFGSVNPLGLELGTNPTAVSRALTSTVNGTVGTVKSKVIDKSSILYDPIEILDTNPATTHRLPKGNNDGALYYIEDAVQLRVLRGGGEASSINTSAELTDVDFSASGTATVRAFVKPSAGLGSTADVVATYDASNHLILNDGTGGEAFKSVTTGLANDTAFPLDIGMTVPFKLPKTHGTVTTVITFSCT